MVEPFATYTAVYERDANGMWLVELAEEPRVHTYGRSLAKAREKIADAAALWFETEPAELKLVEDLRLPRPVQTNVARARRGRKNAAIAQQKATVATAAAVRALVDDAHLTTRDAGAILGLSHQRIQQLLVGDPHHRPPSVTRRRRKT